MKKFLLTALGLAAALASARAASSTSAPAKTESAPTFVSAVPAGWITSRDEGALRFAGPADENGLAARIVVRYYSPGDKSFADADAYVRRQSAATPFDPPGAKPAAVTALRAAGRKARRIVRESSVSVPPNSMNAKDVPTREELVVLPAARGFYVLSYDAPSALFDKNRAAFELVLAGFKPKR
jgi:hypothetical protein